MSRVCSVSAGRIYGKARVCHMWDVPRSTHYARRAADGRPAREVRRGRRPVLADEVLVDEIRKVLAPVCQPPLIQSRYGIT